MPEYNLAKWVEQEENPLDRQFREAVHTILHAISHCREISPQMIMKGAVLLAIRYNCNRYTTDIDFSTSRKASQFDKEKFLSDLAGSLITATEYLDYGLDCRIQSSRFQPSSPEASFPTLQIKIGYAYKYDYKSHQQLLKRNSSKVVKIDYSFNEVTNIVENITLTTGGMLSVYSLIDVIAEKFRAILQQSKRNRMRRQDVYDLHHLFHRDRLSKTEKRRILESLIKKASARDINVDRYSMRDEEIKRRSGHEYYALQAEIFGDLPEFESTYSYVQSFYENLPWDEIESLSI